MKSFYARISKIGLFCLFIGISQSGFSQAGTHLNFDGVNDYINCGANTALNLTASLSVEAEVYRIPVSHDNCIIGKDNYSMNTGYSFWILQNNHFAFRFGNRAFFSNGIIPVNTWVHLAAAYDAGTNTVSIYQNGILDRTYNGITAPVSNAGNLYIGTPQDAAGSSAYAFSGNIDEIRIWNIALTEDDFRRRSNCELNGHEAGLVAYYTFDQGLAAQPNPAVTTLNDITGNGNNGTLTNFALSGTASNWLAGSPVSTGSTIPAAPSVTTPVTYPLGAVATALTATGTNLQWYTTATGGTGSSIAPVPSTSAAGTTSYWVASSNANGCQSERIKIDVIVLLPATHLNFDGTDDFITAPVVLPATNFTVECWFRTTNPNAGLFSASVNSFTNFDRDIYLSAGNIRAYVYRTPTITISSTGMNYADGNWHHVSFVINSSAGGFLYMDGALVASNASVTSSGFTLNNQVLIGRSLFANQYAGADIDELRIWNVARTANEISTTSNCELQGNETGLMAYYKFNQGFSGGSNSSITSLTNSSASAGLDGTLFNFALSGNTSNWQAGSIVTTGLAVPAPPSASSQTFCYGAKVTDLTASTPAPVIQWYATASGGNQLVYNDLLSTGTYYCEAMNTNGCRSARTPVAVTVNKSTLGLNATIAVSGGCSSPTINITQKTLLAADFATLPPGAILSGNAIVTAGECQLTSNVNNQQGTITFAPTAYTPAPLTMSFDFLSGGGSGADGFSLNYGMIPLNPSGFEYGIATSGLVIRFIEFSGSRVELVYNGTVFSSIPFTLAINTYRSCSFTINENGAITLLIGGTTIFNNITIPGYTTTDRSGWQFAFSGRTGALNNLHKIDNVVISTPLPSQFSIDGINWQASPDFIGVAPGTYTVWGKFMGQSCPDTLGTATILAHPVYYVNANATGDNSGTSWANAFTSLQSALSHPCARVIWVAEGTYRPTVDGVGNNPADPRDKTFYIGSDYELYGGFGGNETSLSQRNIIAHPTILSGDIGIANDSTDNAYHVMVVDGKENVTIDGFYIRKGTANGTGTVSYGGYDIDRNSGGGIWMAHVSEQPNKITHNYITGNASTNHGAGIFYYALFFDHGDTIRNNVIASNNAYGGSGGGIYNDAIAATPFISANFIGDNSAANGAGMYVKEIAFVFMTDIYISGISNNVLYNNVATANGGGIYFQGSIAYFDHNTLVNNSATGMGGGIYFADNSEIINPVNNNVFWGNKQNGNNNIQGADFIMVNNTTGCLFKNNSLQLSSSSYTTTGSGAYDLGTAANGNIFAQNPQFDNASSITGPDGLYSTADDGLTIPCGSPLVNAGMTGTGINSDITGSLRNNISPTIGAYEATGIAATTLAGNFQRVVKTQSNIVLYGNCNGVVASVESNGASPVSGSTTVTVWVENMQPANYLKRHYQITPSNNAPTATGRVTLYFTQAEFDAFNAVNLVDLPTGPADAAGIANLLVEKRGGTSNDDSGLPLSYSGPVININPTDGDIVWNPGYNRWEVSFDVTGFSGFFVKTTSFILPVTLLQFTADKLVNGDVLLQWTSADEQNLRYYEVERSDNGRSFETIGIINARNMPGDQEYGYTDNSAWLTDTRYYRLKPVDIDGGYKYSGIVRLTNKNQHSISIYPNPANNMITVEVTKASLLYTRAMILDANGHIVSRFFINHNYTRVPTAHIACGIYWLRFEDGSIIRLIKE